MNMNEMTHRITDAIRRITDRLTHRTDTQTQQPFAKKAVEDLKK
jgi:hypothetical protein